MNLLACAFLSAFLTGFSPDTQQVNLTADLNPNSQTVLNPVAFQTEYIYRSDSLSLDGGFRIAKGESDVTTELSIFPLQFEKIKIGAMGRFHFRNEGEEYNQIDFFAGFNFLITPLSWFEISHKIAYYGCASEIIPLREFGTQWYYNNSHYFNIAFIFLPADWIKLYLSGENCEYFYYRFIGSASFAIGAEIYFPVGFVIGAEVVSRWTDIVTLSANHDGTNVKLSCGYRW